MALETFPLDPAQQKFRWALLVVECMKQLRAEGLPFVDQEVLPSLDGSPGGIAAWFICENHAAKEGFDLQASTQALKNRLQDAGFPQDAIDAISTGVTSQTEIEAGGGHFYFFR